MQAISEAITKRELLFARLRQQGTVDTQRSAFELSIQATEAADGTIVKANRVRCIEDFPVEADTLAPGKQPDFGHCRIDVKISIATGRCSRNLSLDLRGALTPHVKGQQNAVRPKELPALLKAIAGYDELGDLQTRIACKCWRSRSYARVS